MKELNEQIENDVVPPISDPTFLEPESPIPHKKKVDKKKLIICLSIVAVVLAAAGVGAWLYSINQEPDLGCRVTFVDWDDTVLSQNYYPAGTSKNDITLPGEPNRSNPSHDYAYRFTGWSPEIEDVTRNITYKASYEIVNVVLEQNISDTTLLIYHEKSHIANYLVHDASIAALDSLTGEYLTKVANATSKEEPQELLSEYIKKADMILDSDIQLDPNFTANTKIYNISINFSESSRDINTEVELTSASQLSGDMYNFFDGISGGKFIPGGYGLVGNNSTTTINYLTLYERYGSVVIDLYSANSSNVIVNYYTKNGDEYVLQTASQSSFDLGKYYISNICNDDGEHPITITGTYSLYSFKAAQKSAEEITGKVTYLRVDTKYFSANTNPVTAKDVCDGAIREVYATMVSNEDGKTYGAILNNTQYVAKLFKNDVELDDDFVLTSADTSSSSVYSVQVKLIGEGFSDQRAMGTGYVSVDIND